VQLPQEGTLGHVEHLGCSSFARQVRDFVQTGARLIGATAVSKQGAPQVPVRWPACGKLMRDVGAAR